MPPDTLRINYRGVLRCSVCEKLPTKPGAVDLIRDGRSLGEVHLLEGSVWVWDTTWQNQKHAEGAVTRKRTCIDSSQVYWTECDRHHGFEVPGRWILRVAHDAALQVAGRQRRPDPVGDALRVPLKYRRGGPSAQTVHMAGRRVAV